MYLDYCPICGKKLADDEKVIRYLHDKKYHPEYYEAQTDGNDVELWK